MKGEFHASKKEESHYSKPEAEGKVAGQDR